LSLSGDARSLYEGLVHGGALAVMILSMVAGIVTLGRVGGRRYEPARVSGAIAVATVIAGWAIARNPVLVPGLTIDRAAASHDTLVSVIVAVVGGGVLLFPSLALLFALTLRGRAPARPCALAR
jgi:cytochrome d ubiquinol oxidase subunit II